jgi:hypothetical protein
MLHAQETGFTVRMIDALPQLIFSYFIKYYDGLVKNLKIVTRVKTGVREY